MKLSQYINLNTETRMAIRAACAATLCLLITEYFDLTRGYWAALTALSLITPSLGSSIYQSMMRFIMTIFGCFIGWGLYLVFKDQPEVLLFVALLTIFITAYTLYHHFVIRMIVSGISVVILFAFLGGWNLDLLWIRIYETLIGACVALVLNATVLPEFSKDDVKKELHYMIERIYQLAHDIPNAQDLSSLEKLNDELSALEQVRLDLEKDYELARFELFLRKSKSIHYESLHTEVNLLCFYFQALLNTKISALELPGSVRAYLAENAVNYYQERINQELEKFKKIASTTQNT